MTTVATAAATVAALAPPTAAADDTADLRMTKTATYPTVRMGGLVRYTVTLTNLGPGAATDVEFGDPMPDQLNLVDSTCGAVPAFCAVDSLPVGHCATLTILGVPISNLAREERRISNTAFISSTGTVDPNPRNDQSSDIVEVSGP